MEPSSWLKIFGLLSKAVEFVKKMDKDTPENRRLFFIDHIEPSYRYIVEINKDYIINFTKVIDLANKRGRASQDIINFLEKSQKSYKAAKHRIKRLPFEVYNNKVFNKSFSKNSELSKLANRYISDLATYFDNGNYIQEMTWYGSMIEKIKILNGLQNMHPNKPTLTPGILLRTKPSNDKKIIENIINILESRFNWVTESYDNIRGFCLS